VSQRSSSATERRSPRPAIPGRSPARRGPGAMTPPAVTPANASASRRIRASFAPSSAWS